jgi:hypothetical protein
MQPPAIAAQRLNMRRLKRQQQVREADRPPSAAASSSESKTFAQMLASVFFVVFQNLWRNN